MIWKIIIIYNFCRWFHFFFLMWRMLHVRFELIIQKSAWFVEQKEYHWSLSAEKAFKLVSRKFLTPFPTKSKNMDLSLNFIQEENNTELKTFSPPYSNAKYFSSLFKKKSVKKCLFIIRIDIKIIINYNCWKWFLFFFNLGDTRQAFSTKKSKHYKIW